MKLKAYWHGRTGAPGVTSSELGAALEADAERRTLQHHLWRLVEAGA